MKICNQLNHLNSTPRSAITIGNFDGIHLGHLSVLRKLVEFARKSNCNSVIITFQYHPHVLSNRTVFNHVNSNTDNSEEKDFLGLVGNYDSSYRILTGLGIDYLVSLDFERVKNTPYQEFLLEISSHTELIGLVASDKLNFGYQKGGTPEKVVKFFEESFNHSEVTRPHALFLPSKTVKELPDQPYISSSLIREWLTTDRLSLANQYSYLPFHLIGTVTKGRQLGREIGFPTANFFYPEQMVHLSPGSYITLTLVKKKFYPSITYITPPKKTAPEEVSESGEGNQEKKRQSSTTYLVETHLLNFRQSVYNYRIVVFFLGFLGPPVRTKGLSDLKQVIGAYEKKAVNYFKINENYSKKIETIWKQKALS